MENYLDMLVQCIDRDEIVRAMEKPQDVDPLKVLTNIMDQNYGEE
jgi:hypothetical protein